MRLLNTSTLQVEEFQGRSVPEYVILSHTWEKDEVTLQDVESGRASEKKGYIKMRKFCEKAASDGFTYGWIDTCCINKLSSAELSEAINSMYQWYKNSRICYAYLADFKPTSRVGPSSRKKFARSRWWSRGWTLQELLAPAIVEFYDADWVEFGTKISLHEQVTEITSIDEGILRGENPFGRNVAVRMSWAARRRTTRVEDRAYCLLGLFGVNMPLLYGEGERSFLRLQEEILRVREDYTLFTWPTSLNSLGLAGTRSSRGLLADSPSDFLPIHAVKQYHSDSVVPLLRFSDLSREFWSLFPAPKGHEAPSMTSRGLHITVPMLENHYACISLFRDAEGKEAILCIVLERLNPHSERYVRRDGNDLILFHIKHSKNFKYRTIYVQQPPPTIEVSGPLGGTNPPEIAVSLLLVKSEWTHITPPQCYLSSWLSMANLLASNPALGEPTEPFQQIIPTGPRSSLDGPAFANRMLAVSKVLGLLKTHQDEIANTQGKPTLLRNPSALAVDDVVSLAMDNPADKCWFSDAETLPNYRSSGARGMLAFGHDEYPNCAFLVQFCLYEDRAVCDIVPVSTAALEDDENHALWLRQTQEATLLQDRIVFNLDVPNVDDPTTMLILEVAVSIRRVATSSFGVKRYVLSITQKSLARPTTLRTSSGNWDLDYSGMTREMRHHSITPKSH